MAPTATEFQASAPVAFAKGKLGLYFAWAAFSKRDGEDFYDSHGDHIPEDDLVAGALSLSKARLLKVEHNGEGRGDIPLVYPMTSDIAKALGLESKDSGLLIGFRPDVALAASIDAGDIDQLSISGRAMANLVKAEIEKSATATTQKRKRTLTDIEIDEVSLVKKAAHGAGTRIAIAKREAVADAESAIVAVLKSITANRDAIAQALNRTTDTETSMDDLKKAQADLAAAQTVIAKSETQYKALKSILFASLAAPTDQRAYASRMDSDRAEAFFAKTDAERAAEVTAAIAHTSKSGEVFYKSDDPRLVTMAKRDEEREVEFAKSKSAGELATLEKRAADELKHTKPTVRGQLLKAAEAIGPEAVEALKEGDAARAYFCKAQGLGSDAAPGDVNAAYQAGLVAFAKTKGVADPTDVASEFLGSDTGKALYEATREAARLLRH